MKRSPTTVPCRTRRGGGCRRALVVAAAAATTALVLAGCGKSKPETSADAPTRLGSYELATGERTYTAEASMDGTMGFGEALRSAAGGSTGSVLAQDQPVSMRLTMTLTHTVADDPAGRRVTIRIDGAEGHVKAFGVDQDIDQEMLDKSGGSEISYTMKPDGSIDSAGGGQVGGLGVGALGGANVGGSCPRIPDGGVEPGQEWKTTQQVPVAGVQAAIPSTNTYTVDGDTATVASLTDGPVDVTVDFAEFAQNNPSLAKAGNLAGVTMHMTGTADMTSSCVLRSADQELVSASSGGHLSMKLALVGTASNPQLAQLGDGEFLHMEVDVSSSVHESG